MASSVKHPFATFPVLSSEHLTLRRIVPADAPAVREVSFYDGVAAATDEEAIAIMDRIERDYARGDSVHWGVCLRGADEVLGTCGFYRGYPNDVGEVGYILREAYRGRGLMTAALRLVLAFGLEEMRLDGIVAYTDPSNAASIAVLTRSGFHEVPSGRDESKFSFATTGPS